MNYYPFHLGDYAAHTAHLEPMEDLAYRRMIDLYYLQEGPLSSDVSEVARRIRMKANEVEVASVLNEFFTLTEEGWFNERCDEEIAKYLKSKSEHWTCLLTPAQRTAMQAARNAAKANATPSWLSQKDRRDIEAVYQKARDLTAKTGVLHEVDHIIPLRSKHVCGLHVAWNLQAIPAHVNRAKGNYFEVA